MATCQPIEIQSGAFAADRVRPRRHAISFPLRYTKRKGVTCVTITAYKNEPSGTLVSL